jgi:hypothetical protein
MSRRTRSSLHLIAVSAAAAIALTGCGGTVPPTASRTDAASPTPTPTPSPTPVDIRDVDLGTGDVMFSSGGFSEPAVIAFEGGTGSDELGSYTMKDPVYADANDDGNEDALVAIERLDGTAWESLWYVFLSDGEGGAAQVAVPVARASSCGDMIESTGAAPGGGFAVEVVARVPLVDDGLPCSDQGSGRESRVIMIDGEAGDPLALPIQTAPLPAWGGICPGTSWWDTEASSVELLAFPREGSVVVNEASSPAGVFPPVSDPAPLLTAIGVPVEGWAFVVFIGASSAQLDVKPMTCGWGKAA